MLENIIHSTTGGFHLPVSILSLITGTIILLSKKGTQIHRKIGYVYVGSMTLVIITSFMMYRMFGGFGIFHVAAIISFITLLGGMIPFILGKKKQMIEMHYSFMFWSVFGLYAAFASEILTRIPEEPSFTHVGQATGAVMFLAGILFYKFKKKWKAKFVN